MPNLTSPNVVTAVGNLTRDPEIQHYERAVKTTFAIAINTGRDQVSFIEVILWGRQAESASQYLKKGRSVWLAGSWNYDEWQDKNDGSPRAKFVLNAKQWGFAGNKAQDDRPAQQTYNEEF